MIRHPFKVFLRDIVPYDTPNHHLPVRIRTISFVQVWRLPELERLLERQFLVELGLSLI